ncbi:hypothetical protein QQF64_021162 [Cirrhinus molitorella]|uniref:Uncharacterized protein n=1 Tax=Cirrhinus molitorella TaxID=172907 RepID=A0ABR3LBA4_9TELE
MLSVSRSAAVSVLHKATSEQSTWDLLYNDPLIRKHQRLPLPHLPPPALHHSSGPISRHCASAVPVARALISIHLSPQPYTLSDSHRHPSYTHCTCIV